MTTTAVGFTYGAPATTERDQGATAAPELLPEGESSAPPAAIATAKEEPLIAPKRTARLALAVSPWGEVYVDGQRRHIAATE